MAAPAGYWPGFSRFSKHGHNAAGGEIQPALFATPFLGRTCRTRRPIGKRRQHVKQLALAAIRLYQRHLSPHKGFCCAYRVHTGHASCSSLGYRAIRRFGLWQGLAILHRRLGKCGIAHRRHSRRSLAPGRQAGFCDLPCDLSCDQPCHFDAGSSACDVCSNCVPGDCGDWRSRHTNAEEERQVHLPSRQKR